MNFIISSLKVTEALTYIVKFTFMYMAVLAACIFMHHIHAWYPWRSEEGTGFPGTGVIDGVNHYVGTGKQSQVLCKRIEHS